MAIYKMVGVNERLDEVAPTSFGQEGVLERAHLQRILRDQPDVLEEGLLIISEEFSSWEDSSRRIDLLGLDTNGCLVVVELKRGETGEHMDLQAIRYAAMVANMTDDQVVDAYQSYLEKRAPEDNPIEEDAAKNLIREHLEKIEEGQAIRTEIPRIVLASEDFSKELTTCVMWLNDSWLRDVGQEIKCIRLQPHRNGDELLVETSVVVPLPEAADYITRIRKREKEVREQRSGRAQHSPGMEAFNQSIAKSRETYQPGLKRLYDSAVALSASNLAECSTYINGKGDYIRLELRVPGTNKFLVSFNNLLSDGGIGEISFWPGWDEIVPEAQGRISQLVGPSTSKSGLRHRRLSKPENAEKLENMLDIIDQAYIEANGQMVLQKGLEGSPNGDS